MKHTMGIHAHLITLGYFAALLLSSSFVWGVMK